VTAHLTREQFAELKLQPGQQVFVKSKDAKSFPIKEKELCIKV
jgi:sulfate transport system ATP-binding protein